MHVASGREWRGGQRQVWLLARGLAERGDVHLQVVTGRGTPLAERLDAAGVQVIGVPWAIGLDPRVALRLVAALHRDSIVHVHDSHAHALADIAARVRGARLVVTRRAMPPIRHRQRYRRAAAVIAISSAVRRRVAEAGIDAGRIHVIPDAVDLEGHARRPRRDDGPVIVCIAALDRLKGIDVLLDAAALMRPACPEARWVVLGEGPDRARLESRRTQLGLADVVQLPGRVAAPEDVLAGAAVAVQPSRVEALGSSVLDALALGVPVVASDVDGLPDALARGGGVLVPTDAPGELAAAVRRLLEDPVARQRIGDAGRDAARHYGITEMVDATLAVYRSLDDLPGNR